jgi:hypothetical protein
LLLAACEHASAGDVPASSKHVTEQQSLGHDGVSWLLTQWSRLNQQQLQNVREASPTMKTCQQQAGPWTVFKQHMYMAGLPFLAVAQAVESVVPVHTVFWQTRQLPTAATGSSTGNACLCTLSALKGATAVNDHEQIRKHFCSISTAKNANLTWPKAWLQRT